MATVDDLTDMLDFDSEDIDGMDADEGNDEEPAPIWPWNATSSYDVYMVDAPKDEDEERKDAPKACSLEKQPKRRHKRRPKSCLDINSDHTDPALEQGEPLPDNNNRDNQTEQTNPIKDNGPDDITPDRHPEQQTARKRLVATARILKKQKQRLKATQDTLQIRWSKILNTAARYGDNRPSKSYPNWKLLPEFDEEASDPPQPNIKSATWSDRRPLYQHRAAYNATHNTIHDPCEGSHPKDGATRSIYGPRKHAPAYNAAQKISEQRGTPSYRGATHPLCFTDEVLDHEFPEEFKPVNIEAYDGTTDPGVWIEDYILHIHIARGDDLHAIKYLPLKLQGPARHWLKGLPESSIGSWEELEDAFRANFQGLMSDLRMRTF